MDKVFLIDRGNTVFGRYLVQVQHDKTLHVRVFSVKLIATVYARHWAKKLNVNIRDWWS